MASLAIARRCAALHRPARTGLAGGDGSGVIEAFRSFHAEVARLDFVKETVNLAQASRHRLKDGRISLQGSGRAFRIGASTDAAFLPPGGAE